MNILKVHNKFTDYFRFTNETKSSQIYELCSQSGNTARKRHMTFEGGELSS